jgi:hypothetical protein
MKSYEYGALNSTKHEIRLLTIQPSSRVSAQVNCSITTVDLDNDPQYEALSYCWGDSANPVSIKLEGVYFPVTVNLYGALRRLRQKTVPRIFWVDAICINQTDVPERNSQVAMMGQIFKSAEQTTVWLGEAAQNSSLALGLIRLWATIADFPNEEQAAYMVNSPVAFKAQSWKAVVELFERSWWNRVWYLKLSLRSWGLCVL